MCFQGICIPDGNDRSSTTVWKFNWRGNLFFKIFHISCLPSKTLCSLQLHLEKTEEAGRPKSSNCLNCIFLIEDFLTCNRCGTSAIIIVCMKFHPLFSPVSQCCS